MGSKDEQFVLYHHAFSVCSIMVRYTLALAEESSEASSRMDVREESVDLFKNEQIEEHYLTEVNAKGQVRGGFPSQIYKQGITFPSYSNILTFPSTGPGARSTSSGKTHPRQYGHHRIPR